MTDKIDDGGPGPEVTFPDVTPMNGVTLRDWFAGQALAGICAHNDTWGLTDAPLAKAAYQIADAMLSARKANP